MQISLFMLFFAIDLLCVVYFIFISDYRYDARQKQIQAIFFKFEFKIGHKQWRQLT